MRVAANLLYMSYRKVLTFRASSIGDCLMAKYLLDNVHAQHPTARLGIVVGSRGAMIRDLLADYPYIEVVEANRTNPASLWRLWRQWRGSDVVVTQYAGKAGGTFSLGSKLFARLLAKQGALVGFTDRSPINSWLYNTLVPLVGGVAPAELERRALRAAGLAVPVAYPELLVPSQSLPPLGLSSGQYVVVHLFSGSNKRGLAPERRRTLVAALRAALPHDVALVLTGGPGDRDQAAQAAGSDARSVAGQLTLHDTMLLVAHSRGVVSLDTGVGHIAAQMGKPLVVMSSCLGEQWWTPMQYAPRPDLRVFCNRCQDHVLADYPPCINALEPETLAQAALVIMQ